MSMLGTVAERAVFPRRAQGGKRTAALRKEDKNSSLEERPSCSLLGANRNLMEFKIKQDPERCRDFSRVTGMDPNLRLDFQSITTAAAVTEPCLRTVLAWDCSFSRRPVLALWMHVSHISLQTLTTVPSPNYLCFFPGQLSFVDLDLCRLCC